MSEDEARREVREAKKHAIVTLKTAGLFGCAALVVQILAGLNPSKILWYPAGFFLVIAFFELWIWRKLARKPQEPGPSASTGDTGEDGVTEHFKRVTTPDGDIYYERKVVNNGTSVSVLINQDPKTYERALPAAQALIADFENFVTALEAHAASEAQRLPEYAEEIARLKLEGIEFFDKRRPEVPEIVFEETDDGRIWGCAYKNGSFTELSFDD